MHTVPPALLPVPAHVALKARVALERRLGESKVLSLPESCDRYKQDESEALGHLPDAVVMAECVDDVRSTLAVAAETGVCVTARGGGTGRSGGAVPVGGGIVVSFERMNQIKEIDSNDLVAVVQPGVILKSLHEAVEQQGLFYPPDPNSADSCTLGGNVAENAGGPRAFKYGVTRDYVLGVSATLMGGTTVRAGRRTVKGVAGYDVTALLVGSEGTLALFDEITLRLIPKPQATYTILGLFNRVGDASDATSELVRRGVVPRCLELMDAGALQALRTQGVGVEPKAGAMLLIDVDGDEAACEAAMERVGDACESSHALEVLVAQDASQRDRLWAARRELSRAIRSLSNFKLSEDIVVPRSQLTGMLQDIDQISERIGVRTLAYGHAGDGNLHTNFLWNHDDELPRVEQAILEMMKCVIARRGTISGEHGIGVLKIPYLGLEQSPELIDLQLRLKAQFDPKGLLNPGKIFASAGHSAC